ncbi:hypothetical protein DRJ00_02530 [Candidatus Aerophobetes bacterium]|uniref:HTH arsR-type domain-containing protein n=1 Tax=Aerophobetes bacterium TaxID=2030807 RepID=A0A497E5V2_UNCAE|nr:winged helix-turn-helix transcriptional regulator [Candidatus Aerophobetes bacterium]RLE10082.1 MAG: hypothetical protein DRJ00_02530 [Candidatus Aerophobetes bacterium]
MSDSELEEIIRVCKALSDPTRFRIFLLLARRTLCVNAIASFLNVSQPAVSQHLRILREAGLVKAKKRGYWVHYTADKEKINEFLKGFLKTLQGERMRWVKNAQKRM